MEEIFHTDDMLRKHELLVRQTGFGKNAKYIYVDWITRRPAGLQRVEDFEMEASKCSSSTAQST